MKDPVTIGGLEVDPEAFEAIDEDAGHIREVVARAVEAVIPPTAYFKLSNITVDAGKVKREHMALEMRERPKDKTMRR